MGSFARCFQELSTRATAKTSAASKGISRSRGGKKMEISVARKQSTGWKINMPDLESRISPISRQGDSRPRNGSPKIDEHKSHRGQQKKSGEKTTSGRSGGKVGKASHSWLLSTASRRGESDQSSAPEKSEEAKRFRKSRSQRIAKGRK